MFETFYGLNQTPFSRDIPTQELYPSVIVEEILGRLEYAANRQLFVVMTGDCGTGKTTTIRKFKDILDSSKYMFMYISDSKLTPRHFYKGYWNSWVVRLSSTEVTQKGNCIKRLN
jgi:type II secretory pathway predicted ATPase ExeA